MSGPTIRMPKGAWRAGRRIQLTAQGFITSRLQKLTNSGLGRCSRQTSLTRRIPTRVDPRPKQWVPIDARIRRWNIWPGDRVRLVVGKPGDKFQDETSAAAGWKIHTVKHIDMERNTVYLSGVTVRCNILEETLTRSEQKSQPDSTVP